MLRMHKTAGTGSPRFFLIVALLGVALAALPGAIGANDDQLVRDAGIASTVWLDENRDGIRDKTESGLSDVNVSLLDCDGGFLAATRTDARGQYRFDVAQGCYRIRFGAHEGHRYCPAYLGNDTARDSDADPATGLTKALQVQSGGLLTDVDAGAVAVLGSELGDRIWEDMNANGVQDVGEPGLGGVPVVLLDCAGNELTTDAGQRRVATTDADGYFVFEKLPSSCYRMRVLADDAWRFSAQDAAVDALDSDVDPRSGVGEPVQLAAASGRFDMDAGLYRPASVGDWVWFDANVDGLQGKHENGVPGIQVLLLTADGVPTGLTAVTDGKGYFEFSGLKPDDYRVQYIVPAPYRIGKRNQGIDIQLDSDANSLGTTRVVSLRSGGAHVDVDLGLFGGEPVDIAIEKLTNGMDADEPTGPVVEAGADVLWEYIVTNTGDADLFEIAVVDDQGVSVTCPDDFLGSGESFTCTGSTDDAQAGQYVNMATVCGNDQTDEPQEVCSTDASHYFGSVPGIVIETLTNGEDADTPTGPSIVVGDTVMWEYVVTNSGNIELTDVVVVDSEGVTVTCPSTTLAPGVSMTCTATGTSTAGQYMNVGSVTGTPPVGADVSATDPSHYFGSSPLLSIEKTTNGEDADVAPGPTIGVGEPVEWLYTVTNDGNVALGGLNITDSQGVVVTCPSTTLPPGGSITCTGSGVAQDGPYMNLGTACAAAGDNPEVCASDPSHYTGAGPIIDIETLTQNVDADDPTGPNVIVGLPITWDYVVTNTGGTPLSNIVVTDDQGVAINCPATTLEPGESFTCSASGTAEPGQYANIGSVTADGSGETVTDSDPSHYFGIFFDITLEKATNGFDADVPTGPAIPVGEPVTWTYVATNTGNVRLNTIDLFDNQGVDVACPAIDFLDPGESITCTGNGVAQSGQYANIGEVCAFFEEEEVCDTDPSHYFGAGGGLTIEKSTNGEDADTPTGPEITEDDPVNWTYVVTNTGNVTVNNIVVTDDQGVAVDCPTDTLAAGASLTCTGEGIATVGQYANVGSATGQPVDDNGDPVGDPIGDTDPSHYLGTPIPTASIGDRVFVDLDRDGTQNPEEPGLPGVTVNLWVDDDGDGTPDRIIATVVTDANGNYLFPDLDPRLDYFVQFVAVPGQPFTLPNVGGDDTDSDADPDTGISPVINLKPGENNTTIDAGVIVLTSGVSIEKSTNGVDADTPTGPIVVVGEPVNWTYVVTNDGELDLTGIVVTDSEGVAVSCPSDTLAAGESFTCTGTGVATAGQYSNIGTVTGQPSDGDTPIGDPITGDDPSHYFGAGGGLTIEKSTNGEDADTPTGPEITEDDPVNWTYVVTNTGNVTVNNIVVTDDQGVAVSCPTDTLAPGASLTCTGEGIATVGQYANVGSATGQPVDENGNPIGDPIGDTDPSHYLGLPIPTASIGDTVFIDTDRDGVQDPGEEGLPGVTVNLWVDDDGDGTPDRIIATVVTDGNGNYLFPDLDPRVDYFVQFGAVPGQPFTQPNIGDDSTDSDADPATGITPLITLSPGENNTTVDAGVIVLTSGVSIEKSTNGEDADTPTGPIVKVGQAITWTYVVTNDGELDLTGIVVTDSEGVAVSCPSDTLAAGESFTCTGSGFATAGQYSNIGTVTGQPSDGGVPVGDPITGDDPSHYFGAGGGLIIEKSTNGEDADTPTGPEIVEDDPVTWTYVVTNSGNVTVNDIVVTDDQGVAVSCPADSLAPGASLTCTGEGIATVGQYANVGSVTGQPVDDNGNPIGDPIGDTDPSHYLGTPIPTASIGDTVFVDGDRDGIQDPGEEGLPGVTVNLWVDDDGDGIPDRIIATVVTDANGNYLFPDLDPRLDYFVQFGAVPGQPFTLPNEGDDATDSDADPATGITPLITLSPGENNTTVDAGVIVLTSGVSIEKSTNGEDADTPTGPVIEVGADVTWTYVVTNDGELDLINIVVTDSEGVAVSCPGDTLAAGESFTCTGTGTATAGQYSNIGTVTGQPSDGGMPVGDPTTGDDPSHYFGAGGGLTIEKSTNGEDADTPTGPEITEDDPVNWTYVVTNTGNVTVNDIVVTDDQGVTVDCPTDTLAPGATLTCTGEGIATVGQYANVGSATGQPVDENGNPIGDPVGDTDPSHYLGLPIPTASIGDTVFIDTDRDGVQDPGEEGLPGVTVNLWVDDDGDGTPDRIIATVITDANGNYLFPDLDPRLDYFVQFGAVPGQPFTLPNEGDDATDSDADPATGITPLITLSPGENNTTVDAGVIVLTSGVSIEKSTNGEDADTPTGPVVAVGAPITWTYVVTNDGELDLTGIVVTDSEGVAVSCPSDTLAAGESFTCTGTGVATAGQYSNIGTVTGQPSDGDTPIGDPITGDDPSHYFGAGGGLTIEKSTNGEDADTPTGPEITEDDPVNWTYVVTNTGNVTVNNIVVTDDQGVAVSCPTDTLAPGASLTCTGEGIATVGQYANVGSATGQPVDENGNPIGDPIGDTDPSHYLGLPIPTASIGDTVFIDTDRDGIQDPGEEGLPGVTVNLWVDDDGDGTPDRIIATVVTDGNGNYLFPDLDPRLDYFVQFGAVPGQPFTQPNIGDDSTDSDADPATGITPLITLTPGENNTTVDAGVIVLTSGVSVEKSTNGEDADTPTGPVVAVGAPITWTYVVTNDGELDLTGIVVTDSEGVAVSCPSDTLAAGESFTCTGSGVATAGQYSNIGTVTGQPSDGGTPIGDPITGDDPSHYFGAGGGLTIEKSTNGQDADTPTGPEITLDDPVSWTYVVTNTGNVTVSNIVVTDDQGVAVNCPTDTLAPGASLTCTGEGIATLGQYSNIGSATGQPVDENGNPVGDPIGDTDPSHYLGIPKPVASLGDRIFSDDDRDGIQDPGESGVDGRVVNLWVDDDGDGTPDRIIATMTTDALGNYLFTDLDPDLIYFVQFVPVPGQPFTLPNVGDDAADSDADQATGITGPITLAPGENNLTVDAGIWKLKGAIAIEKFTNGQDADAPTGPIIAVGDTVNWTYVVRNTAELRVEDIVVTDDQGVTVTCPMTFLDVGESMTCTGTGIATAGQYANVGSVTGQPVDLGQPVGEPRVDSDPSHYFGAGGGLVIEKSTNGEDADTPTGPQITEDDPVNWTYVVTNTGNVTINNIVVSDDQGVTVSCPTDTLAPGASLTCTASGIATVGQYVNVGSATGQPVDENGNPIGDPTGDTDPSHYLGTPIPTASIGDTVFVDVDRDGIQDPGEPGLPGVTVNLWVDDDGDGTPDRIIATVVTDGNGNYLFPDLDPRLVYFVQFGAVPGQPFTQPNVGDDNTDSDADPATGITPAIVLTPGQVNTSVDAGVIALTSGVSIEKLTNGEDADTPTGPVVAVGSPVNWSYIVTNNGELTLTGIVVTDDQGVTVSCPSDTLDAGASFTCTGSGVATAGQYSNIGTVIGQPSDGGLPIGDPVSGNDPSHYFGAGGGLSIEKTTNGEDADTPTGPQLVEGTPITWAYTVTNTGNVTVTGITVSDSQGVAVSCPSDTLAPGQSLTCTGNGVAVVGQYMNIGNVSGQPVDENGNPIGDPVGGSDPSHYLGLPLPTASIGDTVFVDSDRDGTQDAGEPGLPGVTVNLWVDDDGDGTPDRIIATVVTDGNGNYLFPDLDSRLIYFVQFAAVPGSPFTTPNVGDDATDSDADPATGITPVITLQPGEFNSTVDAGVIVLASGIDIEKATNGEDADTPTGPAIDPGDPVEWTYVVTNTGETTLIDIAVSDDQGVSVSCPADTLAPGASFTCTGSGVAVPGQYANVGSATAQPSDGGIAVGDPVGDSDASHYFGTELCTDGFVADHFSQESYGNNDGDMDWSGPWHESDPQGGGAQGGAVSIQEGKLVLNDYPNSGTEPSIIREVDLSDFAAAMLMFDWSTTSGVDTSDAVELQISADGGQTFTTLDTFTNIHGAANGMENYDISAFISGETVIRFVVTNKYGGQWEKFMIDNVRIDKKCDPQVCVPGDVADHFTHVSYGNNDGSMDWLGNWHEHDPQGGGAQDGAVRVSDGVLILSDYPNSHQEPSVRRAVDLSGYAAAMLMFDWSTSPEVDPSDEVTLKISSNGGQSYTVLDVFSNYHGAASGSETYDISPYISPETVIKFVVTNNFGAQWDKFMVDNVRIDKKCDGDDCVVTSSTDHSIWFSNLDGNGGADRFDFLAGASFVRNADGTARLTGVARKRTDADESFEVDVVLSGGTVTPPPGSPKNNFGADIADWFYYPQWDGTLTGLDDYEGAVLTLTRRGPAFQIGTGANDKPDDVDVYGGSGWFDFEVQQQGDRCLDIGRDCIEHSGPGDFNIRIDCASDSTQVCSAQETHKHALYLPNFNNDGTLDRYDLDSGAELVTQPNGTARLTGIAFKQDQPNYRLAVDLMLSGRTSTPPPGSPYNPQNADPSDWVYYPNWVGTLTGEAWNTGALLNIERRGASFQVGTGANAHPNEQSIFGGSGWFDWETESQPNDCHQYGDCIAHSGNGDVNIQLMCPTP